LIVPGVILFVFMGAWMSGADMGDWILLLVSGLMGIVMKRSGWPRPPLILAIVLGPIMEQAFQISMQAFGPRFIFRPVSVGIGVLIIVTLFLSVRGIIKNKSSGNNPSKGEGEEKNSLLSFAFTLVWVVAFPLAIYSSLHWPRSVKQFPLLVSIPATVLMAFILIRDFVEVRVVLQQAGTLWEAIRVSTSGILLGKTLEFLAWLVGIIVVTLIAGQIVALPLYIGLYLLRWGGYNWKVAVLYAGTAWLVLYGFYDQLLHIVWHQSLLLG
jgi:hypothetical protein